ncbi:MAG TPA: hypothetical protein VMV52_10985 [Candidatus Nanopelagicaceae bacterium]|nr:hypothetical protein [Candidatus Nanopelagicaceae bacterium]
MNTITDCKPWCSEHYVPEDNIETELDGGECISPSFTVSDVAIWLESRGDTMQSRT